MFVVRSISQLWRLSALILPPPGRHFDLASCTQVDICYSGTTLRPILLFQDDISTYPVAPRRHFDLSCCSGKTFRPILLLWEHIWTYPALRDGISTILLHWDDMSTYPIAPGQYFDLSCYSGTTFRPILLLRVNISTYPAAPG